MSKVQTVTNVGGMTTCAVRVSGGRFALPDGRVFSADLRMTSGFRVLLNDGVYECYWTPGHDEAVVVGSDGKVAGIAARKEAV